MAESNKAAGYFWAVLEHSINHLNSPVDLLSDLHKEFVVVPRWENVIQATAINSLCAKQAFSE